MAETRSAIALKPFPLSADGISTATVPAGPAVVQIPADLFPGLKAAGYVREPTEAESAGDDEEAARRAFEADAAAKRATAVAGLLAVADSLADGDFAAQAAALLGDGTDPAILSRADLKARLEALAPEGARTPAPDPDPVAIPDDWEKLPWPERQDLVERATGTRPANKAQAAELIGAELERRAAAP